MIIIIIKNCLSYTHPVVEQWGRTKYFPWGQTWLPRSSEWSQI